MMLAPFGAVEIILTFSFAKAVPAKASEAVAPAISVSRRDRGAKNFVVTIYSIKHIVGAVVCARTLR
jgi:hypothetical protein